MATQALYLKYRPQTFSQVIGQEHITRTLLNAIRQNRIRHAYLFSGPRGTGKTSNARLLAKAINCTYEVIEERPCNRCPACIAVNEGRFLDVIEIDAASHTGVDDVRELREKIQFAPNEGQYKIYIIDEVHRFSGSAFDALLKTLEEPPAHAIFVLATTEIDKVPATIKSRCLLFEFRRVPLREVMQRLREICDMEGISIDDGALELIARQGTGSVRDSISLLDQIVADPSEHISYELAQAILGASSNQHVTEVVEAIIRSDAAYGLDVINHAIDSGADPRQFGRQMVEHLRQLLLVQMGSAHLVDASEEMRAHLQNQAQAMARGVLLKSLRAFNAAISDMRGGWQPQLPLELALVESAKSVIEEAPVVVPVAERTSASAPASRKPTPKKSEPAPLPTKAPKTRMDTPPETSPLSQFTAHWEEVREATGQMNRSLKALLQHCHPTRVEGHTLFIGTTDVFKERMEQADTMKALHAVLHQMFGEDIRVRIELVNETKSTPETGISSDAGNLRDIIESDDLLSYAQNELGAEITLPDD